MPEAIAAASFRNGTLLDDLTRSNAEEMSRSDLASGHAPHGVTITFSTICSGWGSGGVGIDGSPKLLLAHGRRLQFQARLQLRDPEISSGLD